MGALDIIGVDEIMQMTGLGRAKVTKMLNEETCPIYPRSKHEPYMIERNAFITWYSRRCTERRSK